MTEPSPAARGPVLEDFWAELVECQHELPALLRLVAARVVELFGDGCVLALVDPDGTSLQPRAVVHSDPVVDAAMRAALQREPTRIGEGLAGSAAADRRPMLLNDLPPQTVAETTPPQFLAFVRDHPMRAIMITPLVASGELLGTLGSLRTSSDEPYTIADLRLLQALGERAALAMSDAMAGPRAIGPADYEAIYRHNVDGVLLTTPDGHILDANPAACSILGLSEREILHGGRDRVVVAGDPRLARALAERAAVGHARGELTMRRGDGTTFTADVSSTIFTTPDRRVRATVIFRDVSDEVAARQQALERLAELEQNPDRDPLTGLLNRRGFTVAAEQALATADRHETSCQLVVLDVDGLESLDDTDGHAAGDAALLAVAAAIDHAVREEDVAARYGGDEFVILLVDTSEHEVATIIDRIRTALADSPTGPQEVAFSTGTVERSPHLAASLQELVAAADRDMYEQRVLSRLQASARPEGGAAAD